MEPFNFILQLFMRGCISPQSGMADVEVVQGGEVQKGDETQTGTRHDIVAVNESRRKQVQQLDRLLINHSSNQSTTAGNSSPQVSELNTSESSSREGSVSSMNGHFRPVQGGAVLIQSNSSNSHDEPPSDQNNSVVHYNTAPVPSFTHINVNRDIFPTLGNANCIGKGGFAFVYKSTYSGLVVAVKHFRMEHQIPLKNQEKNDAFLKELSIITQLDHKNLVKCYGACVQEGSRAIVMEYVGYSLYDRLECFKKSNARNNTNRHMCLSNILKIMRSIAEGLKYLHSKGIVHRDLHPQNVLIDKNGVVKITDMGISKVLQHTISEDSRRGGIDCYLAPEIFENKVCCASDIYSLGIIANELWSQDDSWYGFGQGICCERIIAGKRPRIAEDTPKVLRDLITHCWQQDFNKRPAASEIVHDCEIELDFLRQQQNGN